MAQPRWMLARGILGSGRALGVSFQPFPNSSGWWWLAAAKSCQSCPTLCDPIDGSPPGSSVHGILQARTLEWVAISFSNAWKWKVKVKLLRHVRLSDAIDWSLLGSSIRGSFQARVLEWGAIAFSWWWLISSVFLIWISCHKTTHANSYYGAWPGWAVSISVLPLTEIV